MLNKYLYYYEKGDGNVNVQTRKKMFVVEMHDTPVVKFKVHENKAL